MINDANLIQYGIVVLLSGYLILHMTYIWIKSGGLRSEYRYVMSLGIGIFYNFWHEFFMRFESIKLMKTLKDKIHDPDLVKIIVKEFSGLLSTISWNTKSSILLFILAVIIWHIQREIKRKKRCSDWNGINRRKLVWNGVLRRKDDAIENGRTI